jgi:hypothetical protein
MSRADRLVVAGVIVWCVWLSFRQMKLIDRTTAINDTIKVLAGAAMETKLHCDVAGERTDELWEEVFNGN